MLSVTKYFFIALMWKLNAFLKFRSNKSPTDYLVTSGVFLWMLQQSHICKAMGHLAKESTCLPCTEKISHLHGCVSSRGTMLPSTKTINTLLMDVDSFPWYTAKKASPAHALGGAPYCESPWILGVNKQAHTILGHAGRGCTSTWE